MPYVEALTAVSVAHARACVEPVMRSSRSPSSDSVTSRSCNARVAHRRPCANAEHALPRRRQADPLVGRGGLLYVFQDLRRLHLRQLQARLNPVRRLPDAVLPLLERSRRSDEVLAFDVGLIVEVNPGAAQRP